jgi:hypothetical protein
MPRRQQTGRREVTARARGAGAIAGLAVLGVIFAGWLMAHPASQPGRHNRPGHGSMLWPCRAACRLPKPA